MSRYNECRVLSCQLLQITKLGTCTIILLLHHTTSVCHYLSCVYLSSYYAYGLLYVHSSVYLSVPVSVCVRMCVCVDQCCILGKFRIKTFCNTSYSQEKSFATELNFILIKTSNSMSVFALKFVIFQFVLSGQEEYQ